jgi:hypothetical protein
MKRFWRVGISGCRWSLPHVEIVPSGGDERAALTPLGLLGGFGSRSFCGMCKLGDRCCLMNTDRESEMLAFPVCSRFFSCWELAVTGMDPFHTKNLGRYCTQAVVQSLHFSFFLQNSFFLETQRTPRLASPTCLAHPFTTKRIVQALCVPKSWLKSVLPPQILPWAACVLKGLQSFLSQFSFCFLVPWSTQR